MTPNRLVYIGAGSDLPISNMFDVDGEETDDPQMAFRVCGQMPDGRWYATECQPRHIVRREAQ